MSFFSAFMPTGSTGGGCFGEPKGLNVGDVLGQIGGLLGLGSVWTGMGSTVKNGDDKGYRPREWQTNMDAAQMVLVKTNIGGLVFDAVVHVDTEEQLTMAQIFRTMHSGNRPGSRWRSRCRMRWRPDIPGSSTRPIQNLFRLTAGC